MSYDPHFQEQTDFGARLEADEYFEDIPVLVQRKGVTESDVDVALAGLAEKGGKAGACVVVLMPELVPDSPDAPGPRYRLRAAVQVIEMVLVNLGQDGTGKGAEAIAERVRQILHHVSFGRGSVYTFAGMEPLSAGDGKISYAVRFERLAGDAWVAKVMRPVVTVTGSGPASVSITCGTAGAALWYTLDGTYPAAANPVAALYAAALSISTACTLRCVAYLAGYQASDCADTSISKNP